MAQGHLEARTPEATRVVTCHRSGQDSRSKDMPPLNCGTGVSPCLPFPVYEQSPGLSRREEGGHWDIKGAGRSPAVMGVLSGLSGLLRQSPQQRGHVPAGNVWGWSRSL